MFLDFTRRELIRDWKALQLDRTGAGATMKRQVSHLALNHCRSIFCWLKQLPVANNTFFFELINNSVGNLLEIMCSKRKDLSRVSDLFVQLFIFCINPDAMGLLHMARPLTSTHQEGPDVILALLTAEFVGDRE